MWRVERVEANEGERKKGKVFRRIFLILHLISHKSRNKNFGEHEFDPTYLMTSYKKVKILQYIHIQGRVDLAGTN